jgi:hypothetical protein
MNNNINNIDFYEKNLTHTLSWLQVLYHKAYFIVITIVLSSNSLSKILEPYFKDHIAYWRENSYFIFLDILLIASFFSLVASLVYVTKIIYPTIAKHIAPEGKFFFFESIANIQSEEFKQKMANMTYDEAVNGLSDQIYNNAQIFSKKFSQLKISIKYFLFGFGFFIVFSLSYLISLHFLPKC